MRFVCVRGSRPPTPVLCNVLARHRMVLSETGQKRKKLNIPDPGPALPFHTIVSKGMAQLVFANKPVVGLLMTSALALSDPLLAGFALLGNVTATTTAILLKANYRSIDGGLYGFNGALYAAGIWSFLSPSSALVAVAVAGAAATAPLAKVLEKYLPVPFVSIPFNVMMISTMYLSTFISSASKAKVSLQLPAVEDAVQHFNSSLRDVSSAFADALTGLSQMVLCQSSASGIIVLAALSAQQLFSKRSPLEVIQYALGGAVIGNVTMAFILKAPMELVSMGLYGFNPALTAIAVYTFLRPRDDKVSSSITMFGLVFSGCFLATFTNALISPLFQEYLHSPAFALPFCIASGICVSVGRKIPSLQMN